ncbi:DUF3986 family protein [Methylovorus glucosotrophus]|uniref:Uncharacterized protein n=1 Tax=Methylovorus glucosotrophus (strain SIP3-4) TaxID=582744 RepID=C6X7X7_METGS|nr:DUF3986 family protein [Methylovorus glucosotrophus]ACT51304.1 hypothetical protein Msip34_2062 [Methylovorus glucosotrophus SIP3-4]
MNNILKNKPKKQNEYSQKDIEAFHLFSTNRAKLLRLIDEGYFSTLDSELISQIINKAHKEADAVSVAYKRKKKAQWDLYIANQQYYEAQAKAEKEKKDTEDEANRLTNLKRLLGLS